MEPEEWARRTREGRAAEALGPAERVLEASEFTPVKVEVEQWRHAMAHRSVNIVNQLALRCRHFTENKEVKTEESLELTKECLVSCFHRRDYGRSILFFGECLSQAYFMIRNFIHTTL